MQSSTPFEGPEKLLEIWFAPSADRLPLIDEAKYGSGDGDGDGDVDGQRKGLRRIDRAVWEEMLDIVKCKVLSVIVGEELDAYLLSESSLFVSPHKIILKTCGTTLNLLGLPRILDIASRHCGFRKVWRCFYSRKSFMFPERQLGPHREWGEEVRYLDAFFRNGSAYTVGKVNGDHWLLYLTSPPNSIYGSRLRMYTPSPTPSLEDSPTLPDLEQDYTIEILMSHMSTPARLPFFYHQKEAAEGRGHSYARKLSTELGIDTLFPVDRTTLDAFAFDPCGYSANALIDWGGGEGYYTIHVTPEAGWSYASFECNVPLPSRDSSALGVRGLDPDLPDLQTLVRNVVNIFDPGRLSITLFVSTSAKSDVAIETAQQAFRQALAPRGYYRNEKINYEFGGYDLAFASFQMMGTKGRNMADKD
ncbi:S-adenosylmethionine decarboxylase [Calocera cornea HHB12733]|uniref:adenosylmethionine decarboxylase n=1 Tax=Calocera cornea HHB12733 TaxID=1353952 RepID=A0A165H5J8_9BASI|nr:S-adenosylmethionine decarboxylase [Calocera cornea HHB12733]